MSCCSTSGSTRDGLPHLPVAARSDWIGFIGSRKHLTIYCIANAEFGGKCPNFGEAGSSFPEEIYLGIQ
jgi:hypothetical protein